MSYFGSEPAKRGGSTDGAKKNVKTETMSRGKQNLVGSNSNQTPESWGYYRAKSSVFGGHQEAHFPSAKRE